MDSDMEKPRRSGHFPEGTERKSWFFIMFADTKLKCVFRLCSANEKKKIFKKIQKLDIFKAYILIVSHFNDLDPKWRQSAGTWQFLSSCTAMQRVSL